MQMAFSVRNLAHFLASCCIRLVLLLQTIMPFVQWTCEPHSTQRVTISLVLLLYHSSSLLTFHRSKRDGKMETAFSASRISGHRSLIPRIPCHIML